MNRIILAFALFALTACGALKATESVPDKMESMNNEVKKTNGGMSTMIDEVRETNEGIKKTNLAVHNQTLAVALAEMMKSENTQILFPPMGMMPAGQVFANEADAEEITKLVYVMLKDIDSSLPDDSERDPATGQWRPETIKKLDHEKMVKFTVAMIICGLAPDETFDTVKKIQIEDGGRYEQTAYAMLMLRYSFVHDFLLQESLFSSPLKNPGQLTEAVRLADQLAAISSLSYANQISVKTRGMLSPDDNVELTLAPSETLAVWRRIDRAFDEDLDAKYKNSPATEALRQLRIKVQSQIPN